MDIIPTDEFFAWAAGCGIVPDVPPPESSWLSFQADIGGERFWVIPERAAGLPFFVNHILSGLEAWNTCYVWPRGGQWVDDRERDRIKDQVYAAILQGAGVPLGERCALRFSANELDRLVTLVFARLVFGWSVPDDVFIIPDHGRQIVQTDHHDVVHVRFRDGAMLGGFIEHMASEKYLLPEEPPDGTFKRPDWMG